MKILYIGRYNQSEELTGPEKVAKRIFHESSIENEAVFIEYFFDGSQYGILQKLFGYDSIKSAEELKIYRLGLLRILPFIIKFSPQIIHIITFERFSVLAYLYKLFSKVKLIYNVHGVAVYENEKFKNISSSLQKKDAVCEKIFMKRSDKLLFLSEYQLSIARKLYHIHDSNIEFINNGIDEGFCSKNKNAEKNKTPTLVFIGDSERKDKDFKFLYSSLDKIEHNCTLYIIGDFNTGIYKNEVGNVSIIPVKKMNKGFLVNFLSDKDIFISSSYYDTFSIAAAECMALGLVPIVTNNTGISKLIEEGTNGFIVNHGDENELVNKINLLLENDNLRSEVAKRATEIYKQLNWKNIFSSYTKIYKAMI